MEIICFDFAGRTAVGTGAARGFGLELARSFIPAGATTYLLDFDEDEVQKAASDLGGRAVHVDESSTEDGPPACDPKLAVIARTGCSRRAN